MPAPPAVERPGKTHFKISRRRFPPSAILFCGSKEQSMTSKKDPTKVEIYGESYNVRGEGDPAYLAELARFVDGRMREVADQMSTLEPMKVAILAALNIADDLYRSRKRQQQATELWMERIEELTEKIGRSLAEPARRTQV